jgi:hypothetical protein
MNEVQPLAQPGAPADDTMALRVYAVLTQLAQGDPNPTWRTNNDGSMAWGVGGQTAIDTNLYRFNTGAEIVLASDNAIIAQRSAATSKIALGNLHGTLRLQRNTSTGNISTLTDANGWATLETSQINFQADTVANLYRASAGAVKTDGSFTASLFVATATTGTMLNAPNLASAAQNFLACTIGAAAQPTFSVGADGKHNWGAGGTSGVDTSLSRLSAGVLSVVSSIRATSQLQVQGTNLFGIAGNWHAGWPGGTGYNITGWIEVFVDGGGPYKLPVYN